MKLDTLDRRLPFTLHARGSRVILQARDLWYAEAIHAHGALTARHLHALAGGGGKLKRTQDRLTKLTHEQVFGQRFLIRSDYYSEILGASIPHELGPGAELELRENDVWHEYAPVQKRGTWLHDFQCAHFTSSVHIATIGTEYEFVPQWEVLERGGRPLLFNVPYTFEGRHYETEKETQLLPDRIFGIRYPNGIERIFVLEMDRGTEPLYSPYFRKSIGRNLAQYEEMIRRRDRGDRLYKKLLNTSAGIVILTVTTSKTRRDNMVQLAREMGVNKNAFVFAHMPRFSRPPHPAPELFNMECARPSGTAFRISDI